ncbi:MAG TPA: rhomboid family intramembrane serine protease [Kofleriaceae bacterium]
MKLPRLSSNAFITQWILLTIAASVVAMVDGGWLASWASLAPERICHGQIWRLVTWIFIERSPLALVFTCVSLYKFGGELAYRWGDRRLRRFALLLIIAGGIIATLGGFVSDYAWSMQRCGGWIVGDLIVIAWARQFPMATVTLYYGLLTLSGERLMYFTLGVTTLIAISVSPFVWAPELVAAYGAAFLSSAFLENLGRR